MLIAINHNSNIFRILFKLLRDAMKSHYSLGFGIKQRKRWNVSML